MRNHCSTSFVVRAGAEARRSAQSKVISAIALVRTVTYGGDLPQAYESETLRIFALSKSKYYTRHVGTALS